jgi:hypothetical protein
MPTTLRRHQVTEVASLTAALETARVAWPEEQSTSRLILRLAELGEAKLLEDDTEASYQIRLARAKADAGQFPYEGGLEAFYLAREEDWG